MISNVIMDILIVRDFRHYWTIGFLTSTARWFEIMAFSVLSWELTGDASIAGWMFAFRMISLGITGAIFAMLGHLFSGVMVMVATQLLVGVSCLVPIFISFTFIEYDVLPVLYVISIFSGILWSVDFSYRRRLLGDTLPSKIVGSGVSLDVLSSHATRLLGMVFGGLTLSMGDENLSFLFLAVIYILSTLLYFGKIDADKNFIVGTWWNHEIIKAKAQISGISGRIIEQTVTFIGKEKVTIGDKTYNTLRFNFKSSDETLPDSKKLNTDIWYDENTYLWVKAAFEKTGYWEYRLKTYK